MCYESYNHGIAGVPGASYRWISGVGKLFFAGELPKGGIALSVRRGNHGGLRRLINGVVLSAVLLFPSVAWTAYPLITDDTETEGTGKLEVEVNGRYDTDEVTRNGVTTESTGGQVLTILSYGLTENADLVLSAPYQWAKVKENGVTVSDERGISDTTIEVKWRFFEKDGLSFALKPGVRIPTGNDEKGLGAGRAGYQAFFIGTKNAEPWTFHVNVGYIRNENRADEEKNIWHASFAAEYKITDHFEIVGNIGIERNRDKTVGQDPAFLLGGVIYEITENVTIDLGVKYGLNAAENDWSVMPGMALRF
jgi:hypothetical protein